MTLVMGGAVVLVLTFSVVLTFEVLLPFEAVTTLVVVIAVVSVVVGTVVLNGNSGCSVTAFITAFQMNQPPELTMGPLVTAVEVVGNLVLLSGALTSWVWPSDTEFVTPLVSVCQFPHER